MDSAHYRDGRPPAATAPPGKGVAARRPRSMPDNRFLIRRFDDRAVRQAKRRCPVGRAVGFVIAGGLFIPAQGFTAGVSIRSHVAEEVVQHGLVGHAVHHNGVIAKGMGIAANNMRLRCGVCRMNCEK